MQLTFLRIETAIPSKMHQSTLMQKDCRDHPQRSLYMLCSDNPCAFKGELQVIFHINYEHTIKKQNSGNLLQISSQVFLVLS